MAMSTLIELAGAKHRYPSGAEIALPSLSVSQGEARVILGPSGSGKSTLLLLIAGMLTPSAGVVRFDGLEWRDVAPRERDRRRGRLIGFVPQVPHLVATLTVAGNVRVAQYLAGLEQDSARVEEALEALGIADLARRYPHQLSRGQQQRVAIARAAVNRPKLVIADEPTASLDDDACARVLELLFEHTRRLGAALIVATHDARARMRCGSVITVDGRVST
jgi:putative ABC transport system ATP-binding protein